MPVSADREWRGNSGAIDSVITELVDAANFSLPQSYLAFLRKFDGGEGLLPVQPWWIALDPARTVAKNAREKTFGEFFPGLFVIGSNGGGDAVAFDTRDKDVGVLVYFDMTNCDLEESVVPLVDSFEKLIEIIGLEEL